MQKGNKRDEGSEVSDKFGYESSEPRREEKG